MRIYFGCWSAVSPPMWWKDRHLVWDSSMAAIDTWHLSGWQTIGLWARGDRLLLSMIRWRGAVGLIGPYI